MIGLIKREELTTDTFNWGLLKWLVTPDLNDNTGFTAGEIIILPGHGHERHNHVGSDELLYFLSGEGLQMVDDGEPFPVKAGDAVFLKDGMFHSTVNTGWETLRILAIYSPGGQEKGFKDLPDYRGLAQGVAPALIRK
jgi:oxalate decarboxylase/phosphoglucose isomerase-like protein (cupin superfamily)